MELAPRGSDTPVTAENRLAYIHRVADYRLNRQIRAPAAAFLRSAISFRPVGEGGQEGTATGGRRGGLAWGSARAAKPIPTSRPCRRRGLQTLIKPEWVRMFNEEELQVGDWGEATAGAGRAGCAASVHAAHLQQPCRPCLSHLLSLSSPTPTHPPTRRPSRPAAMQMLISGGQQGLDLADMRAHVQYAGGYHQEHPVIAALWEALASFTPAQQVRLVCGSVPGAMRSCTRLLCSRKGGCGRGKRAPLRRHTQGRAVHAHYPAGGPDWGTGGCGSGACVPTPVQAAFLRFITSCPRPPLLGFKYLEPPLGIQVGMQTSRRGILHPFVPRRKAADKLAVRCRVLTCTNSLRPQPPSSLTRWLAACWTSARQTGCPPPPPA